VNDKVDYSIRQKSVPQKNSACVYTNFTEYKNHHSGPLKPIQIICRHQRFLHLIAGGHVNPAVSLAMVVLGKLPIKKFPVYVAAQFLGAFAGSCAVYALYYGKFSVHFYVIASVIDSSSMAVC